MKLINVTPALRAECKVASRIMRANLASCNDDYVIEKFVQAYQCGKPVFLSKCMQAALDCCVEGENLSREERNTIGNLIVTLRELENREDDK